MASRDRLVGSASYHNRRRSDNEFMSWILSSVLCFNCPKACVELHQYYEIRGMYNNDSKQSERISVKEAIFRNKCIP